MESFFKKRLFSLFFSKITSGTQRKEKHNISGEYKQLYDYMFGI